MTSPHTSEDAPSRTFRRGFLAAAWATVAGVVLKRTTQPVEAGTDGDVVLGAHNRASTTTEILDTEAGIALRVGTLKQVTGYALSASGPYFGVFGIQSFPSQVSNGGGILGAAQTADSSGVLGVNTLGAGVRGIASNGGTGVLGQSTNGIPIIGQTTPWSGPSPVAIYGINTAGGFGVYGLSTGGHGVVGASTAAGAAGVVGATNNVTGTFAGAFFGPVVVQGNFTVVGGAKSAAVPHPDGSHRRLYCVESPESWFEDFGKGQLECGRSDVTIDPTFAAVSALDDYHVFLTGYEDFELRVSEQTPTGFRVQANDVASNGRFSWRIVAKRKDISARALTR